MTELLEKLGNDTGVAAPLAITFQDKKYTWSKQYAKGEELKKLFGIEPTQELFLSLIDPWNDELVTNDMNINLARPGVEKFYIRQPLEYQLEDSKFTWDKPFITGLELRQIGTIQEGDEIWLSIPNPYQDELIKDIDRVDLTRPGIERFYIKKLKVTILINYDPYEIIRGVHTVVELKKIGNIKSSDEIDQLKDGHELVPLDDVGSVDIKGGEQFFAHKRDGSSS